MANGHAELSPSSAERWMTCPGSVILSEGLANTSSEYADEGTAAHFLAEQCLITGTHPTEYLGKVILVGQSDALWMSDVASHDSKLRRAFTIDTDMAADVNNYVQYVRSVAEATGGTLLPEQRMDISFLTGEPDAAGTSDSVILAGDELIIVDLKFGRGVEVNAENNKQLMLYALAAYRQFEMLGDFKTVRLVISQPRIGHLSEWDLPIGDLLAFGEEVSVAAGRVHTIKLIADDIRTHQEDFAEVFAPSEKGCQWCLAKANCNKLAKKVEQEVGADFEDLTRIDDPKVLTEGVDNATLALKLNACKLIENWIAAVRGAVEAELLAGREVPGYKLVQGKKGARQWINAEHAEKLLKSMKLKIEDMYDMTLISPTTAEKLHKAGVIGPRQWPKIEAEYAQSEGKPSVAPESDKRPALVLDKPEDDFEDLTGEQPDLI